MNLTQKRWPLSLTAGLVGCALALAGCGGSGTSSSAPLNPEGMPETPGAANHPAASTAPTDSGAALSGAGKKIGSTIPTFSHPFFVAMRKGLEEEAKAAGATLNVVDGKDDSQAQLTAIDNFVVQKMDAIILCPTETETLVPGVEKANGAKIPVITVNRTVSGGETVTYVGADDREGGRMQGKAVMEAFPNGAKIVLLQGILGSSPQREREAGLEEAIKGNAKYQIVGKFPYDFQRAKGVTVMETALLKFPKGAIDAVVAQSDDGALAAADVCGQKGRTEIKIVGFNGESAAFDFIQQGKIYATILQDAETQGREAVKATLRHLAGESVPNPQITPLYTVTQKNIKDHKPAWQSEAG